MSKDIVTGHITGYVLIDKDTLEPLEIGKIKNEELMRQIEGEFQCIKYVAIEMLACYGMSGESVFTTCRWIVKFELACEMYLKIEPKLIYRENENINLC